MRRRSIGPDFRLVWLAVLVSSTGDGMFITAFPLLAATLTRDPLLIAGVTIALRLPWLLLSLITGAVADRMDRRRLMIGADIVRFLIVGVLGVCLVAGAVSIWLLYACAFLLGTGETLHVNSVQALLPPKLRSVNGAGFVAPDPFGLPIFRLQHPHCPDCLLAPEVVGLAVLLGPLRGRIEVGDVEVLLEEREVRFPK